MGNIYLAANIILTYIGIWDKYEFAFGEFSAYLYKENIYKLLQQNTVFVMIRYIKEAGKRWVPGLRVGRSQILRRFPREGDA